MDLNAAERLGIKVVRVVDYSPNSVAEHAVALLLAINRRIHRAYNRTRDSNFALDGLMGFDFCGKTVAVVGTGKIGRVFTRIMLGFGCNVIGYDKFPSPEFEALGARYARPAGNWFQRRHHFAALPADPGNLPHRQCRQPGAAQSAAHCWSIRVVVGWWTPRRLIEALKSGQLGGLALDVYEQEADVFFRDLSSTIITDDVLQRLISFPNVIVTGHQAFLTREAVTTICQTTLRSVTEFETGQPLSNEIRTS